MIWEKGALAVRKLGNRDESLLVKWLSDAKVLAFYEGRDRPHDRAMVREHFFQRQDDVTRCLVLFEEKPIGYIQFYRLPEKEAREYGYEGESGIFGTDQFIGEPACWNQGIGTRLVSGMVQYLCSVENASKIVMDPQVQNERAIRCYEKSGLRIVKRLPQHEFHEGEWRDCWLMARNCSER